MKNGFNTYTRYTTLGFGWSNFALIDEDVSDFVGITELEIAAGGTLKAMWTADVDAVKYNIYIRPDNANVFHEDYLLGKFSNLPSTLNWHGEPVITAKIRTEADPRILLQDTKLYYVGVRAENALGVEDSNTRTVYVRPLGMGQAYVFVNDRHISLVS